MNRDNTRTLHSIGSVNVSVTRAVDVYPDASYLGALGNYREPSNKEQFLVHRCTQRVLGVDGIWRDAKGRIQPEPDYHDRYSREYEFIFVDGRASNIKEALQDAQRLEDLNDGDWCYLFLSATVEIDGVEVGSASVGGFESDSGEDYLRSEERSIAREALSDAKTWMQKNCKKGTH